MTENCGELAVASASSPSPKMFIISDNNKTYNEWTRENFTKLKKVLKQWLGVGRGQLLIQLAPH